MRYRYRVQGIEYRDLGSSNKTQIPDRNCTGSIHILSKQGPLQGSLLMHSKTLGFLIMKVKELNSQNTQFILFPLSVCQLVIQIWN